VEVELRVPVTLVGTGREREQILRAPAAR